MDRIGHLALGTPDVAKTANFYKEVFGLQETERRYEPGVGDNPPDEMLRYLYLSDGYRNLTICIAGGAVAVPVGMYAFGFLVEDMDETRERLAAAGARPVITQKQRPGLHTEFKYIGPEGVNIDLSHSQRGWGRSTGQGVRGKLEHLALGTPNVVKTANFYKQAFGLQETETEYERGAGDNPPDEMVHRIYLWDGYTNLTICKEPIHGMYHFGFLVENMDESRQRMEAAGCSLLQGGPWRPGRHNEYKYRGPEGVMIDLGTHGWGHLTG